MPVQGHPCTQHSQTTIEAAFENPEVELELSGGWESEAGKDDSKCSADQKGNAHNDTECTDGTDRDAESMESEGWEIDIDNVDEERRGSLSRVPLNEKRIDTPDVSGVPREESLSQIVNTGDGISVREQISVQTEPSVTEEHGTTRNDVTADNNVLVGDLCDIGIYKSGKNSLAVSLNANYYDSDTPNISNVTPIGKNEQTVQVKHPNLRAEIDAEIGELQQNRHNAVNTGSLLEPIDEKFIEGAECTEDNSDEEVDEQLDLYLPSSQEAYITDGQISAKINRIESILVAQAEQQQSPASIPYTASDVEDLSESESPVFKSGTAGGINHDRQDTDMGEISTNLTSEDRNEENGEEHSDTEASSSDDEESESKTSGVYQIRPSDSLEYLPDLPDDEGITEQGHSDDVNGQDTDVIEMNVAETLNQHGDSDTLPMKRKFSDRVPQSIASQSNEEISADFNSMAKRLRMDENELVGTDLLPTINEDDEDSSFEESTEELSISHSRSDEPLSTNVESDVVASEQGEEDDNDDEFTSDYLPASTIDGDVQKNGMKISEGISISKLVIASQIQYSANIMTENGGQLVEEIKNLDSVQQVDILSMKAEVGDDVARLSDILSEPGETVYQDGIGEGFAPQEQIADIADLESLGTEAVIKQNDETIEIPKVLTSDETPYSCPEEITDTNGADDYEDVPSPDVFEAISDEVQATVSISTSQRNPTHVPEHIDTSSEKTCNITDRQGKERDVKIFVELSLNSSVVFYQEAEYVPENISHERNGVDTLVEIAERVVQANAMRENVNLSESESNKEINFVSVHCQVSDDDNNIEDKGSIHSEKITESDTSKILSEHHTEAEETFASETIEVTEDTTEEREGEPIETLLQTEEPFLLTGQSEAAREAALPTELVEDITTEMTDEVGDHNPNEEQASETVDALNEPSSIESTNVSTSYALELVDSEDVTEETEATEDQDMQEAVDSAEMEPELNTSMEDGRKPTLAPESVTDRLAAENILSDEHEPEVGNVAEEKPPQSDALSEPSSIGSANVSTSYALELVDNEDVTEETEAIEDQDMQEAVDSAEMEPELNTSMEDGRRLTLSPENITDRPVVENADILPDEHEAEAGTVTEEKPQSDEEPTVEFTVTNTMVPESIQAEEDTGIDHVDYSPPCSPAITEEIDRVSGLGKSKIAKCHAPETSVCDVGDDQLKNFLDSSEDEAVESEADATSLMDTEVHRDGVQFKTGEEILGTFPQQVQRIETSPSPEEARITEESGSTDNSSQQLDTTEGRVAEVIISDDTNSGISISPALQTGIVDNVTDVTKTTALESVTSTDAHRPTAMALDQSIIMNTVTPAKIIKAASCSKKACGSEEPDLCTRSTAESTVHVVNACQVLERISPQKTSPIRNGKRNSLSSEEQEQFADALTAAESSMMQVEDDTAEARQTNETVKSSLCQSTVETETDKDISLQMEEQSDNKHTMEYRPTKITLIGSECEASRTDETESRATVTGRMREADCIGLPTPPKRRRIQSEDQQIVNNEALHNQPGQSNNDHNTPSSEKVNSTLGSVDQSIISPLDEQISSTPIGEIDGPILSTQVLQEMSHHGNQDLNETRTEDDLNLTLLESQTDGISDSDSNKENIPPTFIKCENLDDTCSFEDIFSLRESSHRRSESSQDTETNLDRATAGGTLDETVSDLGSHERPLILDETETEAESDSEIKEIEPIIPTQTSTISMVEEPILSTQQLNVTDLVRDKGLMHEQAAVLNTSQSGRQLCEKRTRDTEVEEPPEKRSRPSQDEPILSTQELHSQIKKRFDAQSFSTQDSIQVLSEVRPDAPSSDCDISILENDAAEVEEDADKENKCPPDFMDMPMQTEDSDSEDIIVSSNEEALETAMENIGIPTSDLAKPLYQIEETSLSTTQYLRDHRDLIDSAQSDTDSEIREINPNAPVEDEGRKFTKGLDVAQSKLPTTRQNDKPSSEEPNNLSDDSDIVEVTSKGAAVKRPLGNKYTGAESQNVFTEDEDITEVTPGNHAGMTACESRKAPSDDEDDIQEINEAVTDNSSQNVVEDDGTIDVSNNIEIQENVVLTFIGKTINSAKAKLLNTIEGRKGLTSSRAEGSSDKPSEDCVVAVVNEVVSEEVAAMIQESERDIKTIASENMVYNSDQLVSSEAEGISEQVSPTLMSMDGIADEGKTQEDKSLMISDVASLVSQSCGKTDETQGKNKIPGKVAQKRDASSRDICPRNTGTILVPDEGSSVDPPPHNTASGQFDDADSDDSVAYYEPGPTQKRQSPKVKTHRTRSCRSVPYERPNRLGTTPLPFGARQSRVSTGRNGIQQSVNEVQTWGSQYSTPTTSRSTSRSTSSNSTLKYSILQIKTESPHGLSLPAWNVTIDEFDNEETTVMETQESQGTTTPTDTRSSAFPINTTGNKHKSILRGQQNAIYCT